MASLHLKRSLCTAFFRTILSHLVGKLSANLPEIVSEHMAPEIQAYWAQSMQRNSAEVVLFNLMIIEELKSVMNVLFHLESAASQKQLSSHSYVNKADYMTEKSSELDQLYRRSYKGGWAAETLSLVRLFVRLSPNMRKLNSVAIFTALK